MAEDPDELPTFSSPAPPGPRTGPTPRGAPTPSPASSHQGRFIPGTVLAGRFRIVALLGRGGMGEVYRADDLTLDQPVALKFLPEAASDVERLERFRQEVKIARKVSHPNVCRVYDISEAEGRHFLSMEYVDGEDLATLLRRIGRLPADKALEVARKVSAGLAAAHDKGVLHRDLKPANVMLDGRGNVMITDFGLAALAEEVAEGDVRSGTPAYMAPEQLEGREVTTRSDIYSLGLVLYEIFTGKKAFDGKTLAEVTRTRSDSTPESPSLLVRDLDPAVERAIMRCLEKDPALRPQSVLAVAAALPGGDPLAAALAAGETPSPQVVADAGETTGLSPRVALLDFAAVVGGLLLVLILGMRLSRIDQVGLAPPEVLSAKAREILGRLGYTAAPVDSARGYVYATDFIQHLQSQPGRPDWERIVGGRPTLLGFWYRTSPRTMAVTEFHDDTLIPGIVTPNEPPPTLSGMANLTLDAQGRLTRLQVIPPEKEEPPGTVSEPDWEPLFAAAELDPAQFREVEPAWVSLAASDVRAAWEGTWPGSGQPLRVEAAAFHGRPVFFRLVGAWTKPERMPEPDKASKKTRGVLVTIVGGVVILGGILLAYRNFVRGRGDRRGAFRLALFLFASHMLLWACRTHLMWGIEGFGLFLIAMGNGVFASAVIWAIYMAVEPYIRRHWPQAIISWTRLLAGRLKDPLVGRDLLLGILLGVGWLLIVEVAFLVMTRLGAPPILGRTEYLRGGRYIFGAWMAQVVGSIQGTLIFFFVLFLFRVLLRRAWLATAAFIALFATSWVLSNSEYLAVAIPTGIAIFGIAAFAIMRFGLVALAAGLFTTDLLLAAPLTSSASSWYTPATAFVFLSVLALAAWGFYTSLGGQRLWSDKLFD
jgi:predicted Ser/Thr protein kinase